MLRKILTLTAIILGFSALEAQAAVINSSWVGGEWGFWEDNANWSSANYPHNDSNTYNVTINGLSDPTTINLQNLHTIDSLQTYGTVEINQWQSDWIELTVLNGVTNFGTLEIRCQIFGDVTNNADAELEFDQHMNIFGNLYNSAGGIIDVTLEDIDIEDANIVNNGLITADRDGGLGEAIRFTNSGRIELFDGHHHAEIFDNNNTGIIEGYGTISSYQKLQNNGTIYASLGSLSLHSEGNVTNGNSGILGNKPSASLYVKPEEDVNNNSTIEVNAGGGVTFDCNLVNDTNGVIELLGGTLAATTITQSDDATFKGQGNITTNNLVIESDGSIQLTGPTNIFGNVQIDPNATLEISDGTTLITGQTVCNGTIHMKGGRLIPQGGRSGDCNIIWEPGTYINVADFNLDGKVNFGDFAYFADTWLWQTEWHTP